MDLPADCPQSVRVIEGDIEKRKVKVPAITRGVGPWLQMTIYLSIYLSMHTATPSFLSITRRAALRWRKARTYLGIPGYACETTGSARRQPDHIHMGRLTHLQTENISVLVRREPVPHWYAAQSQKTDALPLSHGGSQLVHYPHKRSKLDLPSI